MNNLYKRHNFALVMLLAVILSAGCVKKYDKNQVVAKVNDYKVTIDDFRHEAGMSIPGASKELILQDIVIKELLLQEAQKMKLDKNKFFMKEIEDYWKQALIKRLITIKGEEFFALSRVSPEETLTEYKRMSEEASGKIKPFDQIAGQIQERLKVKNAQAALDSWVSSLRKNADIQKFEAVLNSIEIKNPKILAGGPDGE